MYLIVYDITEHSEIWAGLSRNFSKGQHKNVLGATVESTYLRPMKSFIGSKWNIENELCRSVRWNFPNTTYAVIHIWPFGQITLKKDAAQRNTDQKH